MRIKGLVDNNWYQKTAEEVINTLKTDASTGLSQDEASARLAEFGHNKIKEAKKKHPVFIFLEQFNDFIIWILIAAAIVSAFIGFKSGTSEELIDAFVIGLILFLNAILGFVQTFRAEKALEALKKLSALKIIVIRQKEYEISTELLVPGDIIMLEAGDKIPADGRIIEAASFAVQESSLTGESHAVEKNPEPVIGKNLPLGDQSDMVFSGTTVVRGRAKVVITATGSNTQIGKIAKLIQVPQEKTPLQVELKKVGQQITIAVLFIAFFVFVFGIVVKGNPVTLMFLTAVSLAVAAVPEGLPAVVTVTLAIGVQHMSKVHAVVKRLHAVETLGAVDYICSDKTGTITLNEMMVEHFYVDGSWAEVGSLKSEVSAPLAKLFQIAVLCNDARISGEELLGDPTETALIAAGKKSGFDKNELENLHKRADELPFDSERKMMTTVNKFGNDFLSLTKGAPEAVIGLCRQILINGELKDIDSNEAKCLLEETSHMASKGYRTLAFAYRQFSAKPSKNDLEKDLVLVGFSALIDPARPEVIKALEVAKRAGIKVIMITGDHQLTAQKIASDIGLLDNRKVMTSVELEKLSDQELVEQIEGIGVFSRVNPEQKVKILKALKAHGHIVSMTGDGVNDAPALKGADIGVAMGITGTDVSKEAADMILTDDNFASIVKAVKLGRMIFDNLKKFISFLLSCNVSEVLTIFFAFIVLKAGVPLLPIQILWINLITDGLPALALGVDPAEEGLMKRPPRDKSEGILSKQNRTKVILEGAILTVMAVGVFLITTFVFKTSIAVAQTSVFTALVLAQLVHSFNYRSFDKTFFSLNTLKNKWLLLASSASAVLHLGVVYIPLARPIFKTTPIDLTQWGLILISIFFMEIALDRVKIRKSSSFS
ncbi:MAG: calcium-translocating P-type ATPase, PMCA-type [Actinobacteria bacterium]|nr:MAG: calcium-translocating P-type ATPase, PMCA-type [Actinomycetota bacterium]